MTIGSIINLTASVITVMQFVRNDVLRNTGLATKTRIWRILVRYLLPLSVIVVFASLIDAAVAGARHVVMPHIVQPRSTEHLTTEQANDLADEIDAVVNKALSSALERDKSIRVVSRREMADAKEELRNLKLRGDDREEADRLAELVRANVKLSTRIVRVSVSENAIRLPGGGDEIYDVRSVEITVSLTLRRHGGGQIDFIKYTESSSDEVPQGRKLMSNSDIAMDAVRKLQKKIENDYAKRIVEKLKKEKSQ